MSTKYIDLETLGYYNEKVTAKINAVEAKIPTKNSQLTNDSLYITNQTNGLANYYLKTETYTRNEVDNKISELIDNAPETLNTLNELAVALQSNDTLTNTLNSAIGTKADKTTVEALQTQVNNIVIPTKVSELTNDKNYLTSYTETDPTVPSHVKSITTDNITSWNNKVESSTLNNYSLKTHDHDTTYSKLNHVHTYSEITGKPTFASVAITGSYNDLGDKPTLFSGNYEDLTNKPTIPNTSSFITKDVNNLTYYTTTTQLNTILNNYITEDDLNTVLSTVSAKIPVTRIN